MGNAENDIEELDKEDTESQVSQSILEDLAKEEQRDFNRRYGWFEIAINVAKETGESFFTIMDKPTVQVLFLATYLMDKVKQIEAKYKNGNTKS